MTRTPVPSRILNLLESEPLTFSALCAILQDVRGLHIYRAVKQLELLGRVKVTLLENGAGLLQATEAEVAE